MNNEKRIRQVLSLTFTGSHLLSRYDQLVRFRKGQLSATRLLASLALDLALGVAVAHVVTAQSQTPPSLVMRQVLTAMETVISRLRQLITWLMGAPAGLKLNSVLATALGKFFLYHIHLWVTFLYLSAPLVSENLLGARYLFALSYVGFGLQVSVAQDTLNLITFHVQCFYAYARRLFVSQTSGLTSLWRLFRGKKYNPLRDRVDSSSYTVDQLFVGTLAFTILLFLYPTTLTYFAVFKVLEMTINGANWALSSIASLSINAFDESVEVYKW